MAFTERRLKLLPADAGRADLVVRKMTQRSRAEVRGLFDRGCVSVNNEPCVEPGRPLQPGDFVRVKFDPHTRYHEKAKSHADGPFRVVFEDEHLIVVDKAARLLTVPTDRVKEKTLVDAVSRYLSRKGRQARALVVHRLDRGVSGLLVLAKNNVVAGRLQTEIRARRMSREYVAVVTGTLDPPEGRFESFLTTDDSLNRKSSQRGEQGQRAVTHYRTEQAVKGATIVRVQLDTGRRHQIRVHFAEAGHPVIGDRRYRPDLSLHPRWVAGRLALHAARLGFRHPATGKQLDFESPLPTEFHRFDAQRK